MEISAAWKWLTEHWAPLSGVAAAITAATVYIHRKMSERRMWKTLNELRTIQANNPAVLAFEPRSLQERKLYETMIEKGLLFRGRLPDQYQVRRK